MSIFRRLLNAFAAVIEQWINDLDFIPFGRDNLEAQYKLSLHLSLIRCSTVIHAFSFYILWMETQIFFKIYATMEELSFMDYFYGFLIHIYWTLLATASAILIFFRRHSTLNFYNVIVLFVLSLGTIFEYGWYYFMNEWLRDYEFCEICHDGFPIQFFIKIIQIYLSVTSIYNSVIAYLRLKEHQKILDTISSLQKFASNASKGG